MGTNKYEQFGETVILDDNGSSVRNRKNSMQIFRLQISDKPGNEMDSTNPLNVMIPNFLLHGQASNIQ